MLLVVMDSLIQFFLLLIDAVFGKVFKFLDKVSEICELLLSRTGNVDGWIQFLGL